MASAAYNDRMGHHVITTQDDHIKIVQSGIYVPMTPPGIILLRDEDFARWVAAAINGLPATEDDLQRLMTQ